MRLLIYIALAYVIWKGLKGWLSPKIPSSRSDIGESENEIDDLMAQDPYCKIYFPKRNGFYLKADGEDLYFCSLKCKEQYMTAHTSGRHS